MRTTGGSALPGSWIPYQSKADFFILKVERRIYAKLYGGLSYIYADVITTTETTSLTDSLTLHGIGLNLSLDTRSNPYYPRSGYYTTVKYNTYPELLGNETATRKIEIDHNHFFPTRMQKDVVAARFYAGLGLGDLAFNQQFIVKDTDIRAYTQGAYRGSLLIYYPYSLSATFWYRARIFVRGSPSPRVSMGRKP